MQELHHLIHALSREEKRIIKLNPLPSHEMAIYEAYLQEKHYSPELDQKIFQTHFSNLSRSYYSMVKRNLLEHLLFLLLQKYEKKPLYRSLRYLLYYHLLAAKNVKSALPYYLQKLMEFKELNYPLLRSTILRVLWEEGIRSDYLPNEKLYKIHQALENDLQSVTKTLHQYEILVKDTVFDASQLDSIQLPQNLDRGWNLTKKIIKQYASFEDESISRSLHRFLLRFERTYQNDAKRWQNESYLQFLTSLLRSALENGDFILLNRYKEDYPYWSSEVPSSLRRKHFALILSYLGIYAFLEGETITAFWYLRESQKCSEDPHLSYAQVYHLLALLGSYHFKEGLLLLQQTYKELLTPPHFPGVFVLAILFQIWCKEKPVYDLSLLITRFLTLISKRKVYTPERKLLRFIDRHLEKLMQFGSSDQFVPLPAINPFPEDLYPLIKVNEVWESYWRQQNHYQLLIHQWKKEKKVF